MKNTIFIVTFLVLFSGCIKDILNNNMPFAWVEEDNQLKYNFISDSDTIINALTLSVITNPGNSNLRFKFEYPQWASISREHNVGSDYNVFRKKDGLYTSAYTTCSFAAWTSFEFIRAPVNPSAGEMYPDYYCGDNISTSYNVLETNKSVNVPLGVFTTYVLQDTSFLKKEYWNEKIGIIRFDLLDTNGILTGHYELNSINF